MKPEDRRVSLGKLLPSIAVLWGLGCDVHSHAPPSFPVSARVGGGTPAPTALAESLKALTAESVKSARRVVLGRLGRLTVNVAYDAIKDADYAERIKTQQNALVVTVFFNPASKEDGDQPGPTELGAAVLARLSSPDADALNVVFKRAADKGVVAVLPLRLSPGDKTRFPLDLLYVLSFEEGSDGHEKAAVVEKGLDTALKQATEAGIENVIIPALTVCFTCDHRISMRALYARMWTVLGRTEFAGNVYLDLYSGWPRDGLDEAIAGLRESYESFVEH